MSEITTQTIKELRDKTGAGMMDAKKALVDAQGDVEKAIDLLRQKGAKIVAKKAGRSAQEGVVESYIHQGGIIGVLVEVNCETDFVARSDAFKELAHDIALHIAGLQPSYVSMEDVPADVLAKERAIYEKQVEEEKKPAEIKTKIIEGKLAKFKKEASLLEQPFVKNPDMTVRDLITEKVARVGENIKVKRFVVYRLGE